MSDVWQQIVAEALNEGVRISRGAVPGAKLRQLIARAAEKYGEKYPPAGRENEKFGDFLNEFGSLLITLRRDGQDILVAPPNECHLESSSRNHAFTLLAHTRRQVASEPRKAGHSYSHCLILWRSTNTDSPKADSSCIVTRYNCVTTGQAL
jgi:hypothetical protein